MNEESKHTISNLYDEISNIHNQLLQNTEKVIRLRNAYRSIEIKQDDFLNNISLIDKPLLSKNMWSGRHADRFLDIRENIADSYKRIGNQEIGNMLRTLQEKISFYEGLNQNLNRSISSRRERIEYLRKHS